MFSQIVKAIGGDPNKREIEKLLPMVERINGLEAEFEALSDEELREKTNQFRQRLEGGESLDDLLPEAFAAVREASKRTTGMRHYDVQLIGGMVLHQGKIAEMRTGEGKTLVATLPLYLNALEGKGVHLVTVNDYLARRDARWMAPIYDMLGMRVGVLQMASRTEGGSNAFLVDLEKRSPHEDQDQLRMLPRREAYAADITYGTNNEFGFDYLRDNLTMSLGARVQRGHEYAIVDEVDNILVDEARTPLIISGPASMDTEWYIRMAQVVRVLKPEDYEIEERDRTVTLTEAGEAHVEDLLGITLRDPDRPEDIDPQQAHLLGYLEQALRAQFLFKKNKDYIVQSGKVVIVDEFTGRLMPGRRWSEGLHQAVEAKEGVRVEPENVTYATITLQNYFRMYKKLSGMTGTAATEAEEFHKIYKLEVLPIPTNLEYRAMQTGDLQTLEERDPQGYRYTYYARRGDDTKSPVFWKRKDYTDVVFRSEEAKLRAITQEILTSYVLGRPVLVGTTSVEHSERLSQRLQAEPLRRLVQVLLIRQAWMEKNNIDFMQFEAAELKPLNQNIRELDVSVVRPLARSLELSLNPEDPANIEKTLGLLGLEAGQQERLLQALRGGIPHKVLNARKHDEESKIIENAGLYGSITIATNMAGRGVDIKLGGELDPDITRDVNRVLRRAGILPYDMTIEERRQALRQLQPDQYGIYEEAVKAFLTYCDNMETVRALGGLHIIGSERHEARRIDNQLRGRAARQGDPGSSRFYLSMEDDLMRLFGGGSMEAILKRIKADEALPIEAGMLGRIVEQSQERVEGANFDTRKHLLEYDDVLNTQRSRIYSLRDRAFTKEDLSEDVLDLLRDELKERVPQALKDNEGPWQLLAYLDSIQPTIIYEDILHPSFTFRLLIEEVRRNLPENPDAETLKTALLQIAEGALRAEKEHLLRVVNASLEQGETRIENQREERRETAKNYLESLREAEEGVPARRPQELLTELSDLIRTPLRLNGEQLRALAEGDRDLLDAIEEQVDASLYSLALRKLVSSLETRLGEPLGLASLQGMDWSEVSGQVAAAAEEAIDRRVQRLLGADGALGRDLDVVFNRESNQPLDTLILYALSAMTQESRLGFDQKTHRKVVQRRARLNYTYLAAELAGGIEPNDMTNQVLEHMEAALKALCAVFGRAEWQRLEQSGATLVQLDGRLQEQLQEALGLEHFEELAGRTLFELDTEDKEAIRDVLGKRLQNAVYRDVLLNAITNQWVDYLTQMEALRVSIGMESYAQRDPLVQYKSRASDLFKQLLNDIRTAVIRQVFIYRPRKQAGAQVERDAPLETPTLQSAGAQANQKPSESQASGGGKHKKKRHRH